MQRKETASPSPRLEAILAAKEERWTRKLALARSLDSGDGSKPASLAVLTLRMPGLLRSSADYIDAALALHLSFTRELRGRKIPLLREEFLVGGDGPESYLAADLAAVDLKRLAVAWEQAHPWGDIADLDVMDSEGNPVGRGELGYPRRLCLVCGSEASSCVREGRHGIEAVEARIDAILGRPGENEDESDRRIGGQALAAVLMEASAHPKPGLVSPLSRGAHSDMDYSTFLSSAAAIGPWFREFARLGRQGGAMADGILPDLRRAGISAEGTMFAATGGVNTHKGLIFSLGLLCAASGRLSTAGDVPDAESCASAAASMVRGVSARDFGGLGAVGIHEKGRTTGERLYLQYGLRGIRGEAEDGFPSVLGTSLPRLRAGLSAGLSANDAMIGALLALFTVVEDTNVLGRSGPEGLAFLRSGASRALARGGMASEEGRKEVEALDLALKERNISPGGCADLLAVTVFLDCLRTAPMLPSD